LPKFRDLPCYKYKSKLGGLNVFDAKRQRARNEDNNIVKLALPDALLDSPPTEQ
jgi:hypothetical protein